VKDGSAPPVRHAGNTLTILRKEIDGRWLLARDANLLVVEG
jgi:ketosteroid isomerase-like protein